MNAAFAFCLLVALAFGVAGAVGYSPAATAQQAETPIVALQLQPVPVSAPASGPSTPSATFAGGISTLFITTANNQSTTRLFVMNANWVGRPVFTLVGAPPGAVFLGAANCSPSCTVGTSFRITTGAGTYTWRVDVRQVAGGPVVGSLTFVVTVT